jgi:hypothetical protein
MLEWLDWFFVSQKWSLEFVGTMARTLTSDTSDHVPCAITIKTEVPRSRIFWFENYWLQHKNFQDGFQEAWQAPNSKTDLAMRITTIMKATRKCLKEWQKELPKLAKKLNIAN